LGDEVVAGFIYGLADEVKYQSAEHLYVSLLYFREFEA
jgi:hypothetical protein